MRTKYIGPAKKFLNIFEAFQLQRSLQNLLGMTYLKFRSLINVIKIFYWTI